MKKGYKGIMPLLAAHALFSGGLPISRGDGHAFHLPDIAENERIKERTPKLRKHATKRRRNKLYDKKQKGRQ